MSIFERPESVTTQSRHSGFAKAGLTNAADVVEALVDRVVEHVRAVLHRDPHQLLDERRADRRGRSGCAGC